MPASMPSRLKKSPEVVEDHLFVIVIIVEERHLERLGVGLRRARREGADHEAVGDEGGVGRGRQVVAVAHQRADFAHIELGHREVAVPADGVERIEGEGRAADSAAPLDPHLPCARPLLGAEGVVDARQDERSRVEYRMAADHALLRQPVEAAGRLDQQRLDRPFGVEPPHGAARDDDIVALLDRKPPVIAEEVAVAPMQEQQVVAVPIADEVVHPPLGAPETVIDMGVVQHAPGLQGEGAAGSLLRSKARGRSGPSQPVQAVGGLRWYICAAGPKKPSRPSSRSNRPSGSRTCARRLVSPSLWGKEIQVPPAIARPSAAILAGGQHSAPGRRRGSYPAFPFLRERP